MPCYLFVSLAWIILLGPSWDLQKRNNRWLIIKGTLNHFTNIFTCPLSILKELLREIVIEKRKLFENFSNDLFTLTVYRWMRTTRASHHLISTQMLRLPRRPRANKLCCARCCCFSSGRRWSAEWQHACSFQTIYVVDLPNNDEPGP